MQSADNDVNYTEIKLEDSLKDKFKSIKHVAHALLFFTLDDNEKQEIHNELTTNAFGLMQMRSDGQIGFPGGVIDEEINGIDDILIGLNRELKEEINCDELVLKSDHLFTSIRINNLNNSKLILHFFVKKLSKDQFENIEINSSKAIHYLTESLGIFRVLLKCERFLANFLNCTSIFCGNSREQLIRSIEMLTKNKEI